MKLYYIANAQLPHKKAYAIQIAKMCEAFVEEGVDLELIIPSRKGVNIQSIKEYYQLRADVHIKRLPVIDIYYKFGKWGFFFGSLSFMLSYSLYLLWKRIHGERGVVYTIDMDTFSFMAIMFLGMPYFLETHGGKAKRLINTIFFKHLKGVVVINSIIKRQIAATLGYSEDDMLVWPNGIDLDLFKETPKREARERLNVPLEAKIVMYAGRFYGWKGFDVLVDATAELPADILVYIVGGTKEEFKAITKRDTLPDNFIFPGETPYTEIPLWLSAADALLVLGTKHDTQSYYYTSPMKVFEYLAMKRPIIASKTPAIQDIVSSKEVIFYEPDNAHDLAVKMLSSVNGGASNRSITEAAFARAHDFTWRKRAHDVTLFIKKHI